MISVKELDKSAGKLTDFEVNKLKKGYPTELHIWRNAHDRTETFTDKQLIFL